MGYNLPLVVWDLAVVENSFGKIRSMTGLVLGKLAAMMEIATSIPDDTDTPNVLQLGSVLS